MGIKLFNTMTRFKEDFQSMKDKEIGLYTCGPTVYNYVHIGNLRTFLFEDILVRYFTLKGYKVRHIMNITDVDDKTIKNSIKERISLQEYTERYTKAFLQDIQTLNIKPAERYPKATDHVQEMIDMIQKIIDKDMAYVSDGSVYFRIDKSRDYGKLANIDRTRLMTGKSGRIDTDEYEKETVGDFVLWKGYTEDDGDVCWESPFGKGRPGWHIECSAMSTKYLGDTFDIHTGGVDNIFPHHVNEIAQSEAATEKSFVRYWMHSEFLNMGEKMSKSLGNVLYLKDLIAKGYRPMAIRYALISAHYRMPLNFSMDLLDQAESSVERLQDFVRRLQKITSLKPDQTEVQDLLNEGMKQFIEAMDDDLNISPALAAVFETMRKINILFDSLSVTNAKQCLEFMQKVDSVIGVLSFEEEILEEDIRRLIEERQLARKNKDFVRADAIRDELLNKGIELRDTKEGVQWSKK